MGGLFSLLTVNLYNGRTNSADLDALIDRLQPDVVAAQELAHDAATVLSDRYRFGAIQPATDHSGMALAAVRPMKVEALPLPHRSGLIGDFDGTEILAVHLANPMAVPFVFEERKAQVAAVMEMLAKPARRILVGDLNATPIWPAYRRLTRVLTDGIAELASSRTVRPRPTWGYRPWLPAFLRIDHVLVSGMVVTEASVHRMKGGDHRALFARLEVAE
jgi:endonuclease/exonuclease/phosphatase (EEP) superfamily protein YafD